MSAQDICQHAGCGHPRSEHDDAGSCVAEFMHAPKSPECPCEGFMAPVRVGAVRIGAGGVEVVAAPPGCDGGHPGCSVCDAASVADEQAGERVTDAALAEVLQLVPESVAANAWYADHGALMARELVALRAGYAEHERKFEAGAGWFREMADRPMPCGHTIADLIGGDGSVTQCGACLSEKKPGPLRAHPSLREIAAKRDRQIEKWGTAAPSGGFGGPVLMADLVQVEAAKRRCEAATKAGTCTMRDVLEEEVAEVFAENPGSARQRAELVQVAAVCVKWIELIDRGGK